MLPECIEMVIRNGGYKQKTEKRNILLKVMLSHGVLSQNHTDQKMTAKLKFEKGDL